MSEFNRIRENVRLSIEKSCQVEGKLDKKKITFVINKEEFKNMKWQIL